MLSLSERKNEHRRVLSSVAKDFSNPILVWPGESDVKSEEEEEDESNDVEYVKIQISHKTFRNHVHTCIHITVRRKSVAICPKREVFSREAVPER